MSSSTVPSKRGRTCLVQALRNGRAVAVFGALLLVAAGCQSARYGVAYDRRLPELRRIAVLPAQVEMHARHTGGVLERRPDLEPDLARKTLDGFDEILRERGREPKMLSRPTADGDAVSETGAHLALLAAVRDAIVTHHYEHGRGRIIDYVTADAPQVLGVADADALLCVYVTGVVPTGGRKALRGTAAAVGLLTGVRIRVTTHEAVIMLMLVDAASGEVLWFDMHRAETSAAGERRLRAFVEKAGADLLKPRK